MDIYLASDAGTPLTERIGLALLEDPTLEQLFVDLLNHPDLTRILKRRALALLQAHDFSLAADVFLLGVVEGRPLDQQLTAVKALLGTESTRTALRGVFADVSQAPALNALVVDALVHMLQNLRHNRELARELASIAA